MNNETAERIHYPGLDGLRGIAILLVILYHNFGFITFFNYGWLGVDLFFVLSGFLITEILLQSRNTSKYFRNFYARRMLRIFPLYYLSLILIILVFPFIKNFPFHLKFYTDNQIWFWFYMQNWLLILKDWDNNALLLNHFWSLAVEEQFYIIWPLLLYVIKKPRNLMVLIISVLVAVVAARCIIWYNKELFPVYGNLFLFTRIDGILIGALLALLKLINYNFLKKYSFFVTLFLACVNFLFYFINKTREFTFPYWAIVGYTTFTILFAMLVYETIQGENRTINFLLNIKPLKFFGKISYGLYVFHWPVYLILYSWVEKKVKAISVLSENNLVIVVSILLTIIGILISIISFYTFESYFLKKKKAFN